MQGSGFEEQGDGSGGGSRFSGGLTHFAEDKTLFFLADKVGNVIRR